MLQDYLKNDIHVGDLIIYFGTGKYSTFEIAVVYGIDETKTQFKLAKPQIQFGRWVNNKYVRCEDWSTKKVMTYSPNQILVVNRDYLSCNNLDRPFVPKLFEIQDLVLSGEFK